MLDNEDIALDLLQNFKGRNVLLYVGKNASPLDTGKNVAVLHWQYVITSNTAQDFGLSFADGVRRPIVCTRLMDIKPNLLTYENLPVVHLYGKSGIDDTDGMDADDYKVIRKKEAIKLMDRIVGNMDMRSVLVVTGYAPWDESDFPLDEFRALLIGNRNRNVYFFGMGRNEDGIKQLHDLAVKQDFVWCENGLYETLKSIEQNAVENADGIPFGTDKRLFYTGGQPVTIDSKVLLRCRNFVQLLTEESVNRIAPFGRAEQSIWYYNFLNESSATPQWYGYHEQSHFHLKRPFEGRLINWTHKLLDRAGVMPHGPAPIILLGAPGSSKSVALGALAYNIFCERKNPVIYIKGDSLLLGPAGEDEMEQLNELLMTIERYGKDGERILVLWDSSSYKDVSGMAYELTQCLKDRGRRRFVLVCTAYGRTSDNDKEFDGNCYLVHSSRVMSEREKFQLRCDARKYLNRSDEEVRNIWKGLEGEADNDIFTYFYRLADEIRPQLEGRLTHEHRMVASYVNKRLADMAHHKIEDSIENNVMAQALLKAGIVLTTDEMDSINKAEQDNLDDRFDIAKFDICVAMFSRFRLDAPYELLTSISCKNGMDDAAGGFIDKDLFSLITTDIPWIRYEADVNGNFVFRFRNSLEAEIFLKNNGVDANRQMQTVIEILDTYSKICSIRGYEDDAVKQSVAALLRMIGPNSKYIPFMKDGDRYAEHNELLKKLDMVIDKLSNMLSGTVDNFDNDALFGCILVTFIRERYGSLWNDMDDDNESEDSCVIRLQKLQNASDIALSIVNDLEAQEHDNHITRQINTLRVEISQCSTFMRSILDGCSEQMRREFEPSLLKYHHLYQMLVEVIDADSTNGYAYNALFKLFEDEYERCANDSVRQVQMASGICTILDDACSLEINNRGMNGTDEIAKHIVNIKAIYNKFDVTIENIENGSCPSEFKKLFDTMLSQQRAAGIMFVCQREIEMAGISGKAISEREEHDEKEYVLNSEQLNVCQKIVDFMQKDECVQCVEQDLRSIHMLLRVQWMLSNKRAMNDWREAQLTYITNGGWKKIAHICEMYENCDAEGHRPVVKLIYALAITQLDKNYEKANRMVESIEGNSMSSRRMSVPYMLCNENGTPKKFSGTVRSTKNYGGFINVNGVPSRLGKKDGVRFSMSNIGRHFMPKLNEMLSVLELGLGYTGFSVYTEEGRKEKELKYEHTV